MNGLNDIYALSVVRKEFIKAVNEKWKKELEDTIDIANTKWTDEE